MNILTVLFSFKGSISRKTYWLSTIGLVFICLCLMTFVGFYINPNFIYYHSATEEALVLFFGAVIVFAAFSFFSLQVRRCHDIGLRGFFALLSFLPYVNFLWWLLLGILQTGFMQKKIERINEWEKKQEERQKRKNQPKIAGEIINNYEKYAKYTKENNWSAICELDNIDFDTLGTKKELKILPQYLEPDEVVFALTSGVMGQTSTSNSSDVGLNTWLVVLTSDRFLFLDAAMLTESVDIQSIRHNQVQAVSASQGWILGKIMVDIGSRVVAVDNCPKEAVKVIADLANKWLKEISKKTVIPQIQPPIAESPLEQLEKLGRLRSNGVLSEDEFNKAKEKILALI